MRLKLRAAFSKIDANNVVRSNGATSVSGFIIGTARRNSESAGTRILSSIASLVKANDNSSHMPRLERIALILSIKFCVADCRPC